MKIGFQGVRGAYSELAGRQFFTGNDAEFIGLKSFEDIFDKVDSGELNYGMIPIENSLAGSVHKNIDLLNMYNLKIVGELCLRVEHNLLGVKGSTLDDVKEVYSHWQVLAQCQDNIKSVLPQALPCEYFDMAGSAEYISEQNDKTKAAIASSLAGEIYGLEVLRSNFEDNKSNYTRFVVVNKNYQDLEKAPNSKHKISITFSGKGVSGFMYSILKSFAEQNINLTKVEPRPIKEKTWNYFFYIDFEGSFDDADCASALREISEIAPDLKVLGSYPFI
jgi:chorismate mutase/prephenate dehydratase